MHGRPGTDGGVRAAYAARAAEYISRFGSLESTHPEDRTLIAEWAEPLSGHVLDVGCGPGQWSSFLADRGTDVEGFDPVPEFVEHASTRFPNVAFRVAGFRDLPVAPGSVAGILTWYSLIHTEPEDMPLILEELGRRLAPGGALLLGFFEGARVEQFPHAVAPAYFWPAADLEELLQGAGFDVVSVTRRTEAGVRPHAAISARLRH